MHKQELINKLQLYANSHSPDEENYELLNRGKPGGKTPRWKGQRTFAEFFAEYLKTVKIPADEEYDFWRIEPHLPQLAVEAFEHLRTGTDVNAVEYRKMYEASTGHKVPNITDLGASNLLDQTSAVQTALGFTLKDVLDNDWIANQIHSYCNAQQIVLQQTFDKFLRLVYRRGLGEMADKCDLKGMSGKFGETVLRTCIVAGRIMFTFAKRIDTSKPSHYKEGKDLIVNEWSVSFVGEDGDPLCLSAGIQSVACDFRTSLDMIEDVIQQWPKEPREQKKIFKADKKVSLV